MRVTCRVFTAGKIGAGANNIHTSFENNPMEIENGGR
jgi:hypothetical protein